MSAEERLTNEAFHVNHGDGDELEDNNEAPLQLPSDTELVIDSIQGVADKQFGFVLQHQIYATLSNRSIVDEELHSLRHVSKTYKFLQCDFTKSSTGSTFANATLIIKTRWYINSISQFLAANKSLESTPTSDELLRQKFSKWVETSTQMSVFRHELKNKELWISSNSEKLTKKRTFSSAIEPINLDDEEVSCTLSEAEIDRLVQVGFLHYRNTSSSDHEVFSHGGSGTSSSGGSCQYGGVASTRDQELYWLAHPAIRYVAATTQEHQITFFSHFTVLLYLNTIFARSLVRCLQNAEQSIVSQIKKNQYKEMSEKKLRTLCGDTTVTGAKTSKKTAPSKSLLGDSPFPLSYHLLDLEGRKVLYKVAAPATSDFIWRVKT